MLFWSQQAAWYSSIGLGVSWVVFRFILPIFGGWGGGGGGAGAGRGLGAGQQGRARRWPWRVASDGVPRSPDPAGPGGSPGVGGRLVLPRWWWRAWRCGGACKRVGPPVPPAALHCQPTAHPRPRCAGRRRVHVARRRPRAPRVGGARPFVAETR
jgi:hypothetical protein